MPGTRRTPIGRTSIPVISPEAVTLFERGKRLIARGDEDAPALRDISLQLAMELKLRPWMTCPLDTLRYSEPAEGMDTEREREDWYRSAGIRDQLEAALKARRRAEREARKKAAPDQPTPPPAS
jgi:hypothetical protein